MKIRMHAAIGFTMVMLLLVGCATTDDPSEGGLFNGIRNLSNDGYIKRIEQKEEEYAQEVSEREALKIQAENLRRERAAVREELKNSNRRLINLEQSIRQERDALHRKREKTREYQEKLRQLENAQKQLEITRQKIEAAQKANMAVNDYRETSEDILKDLDDLDEIVDIMTSPDM